MTSIIFIILRDEFTNIHNFCRRKNCKTVSSYNYENLKPKYCFKHKKEDMVNVKRGHKLCLKCKSSYKTKCTSPKCKYTIEKYKTASKYMKLKNYRLS